MRSTVLVKLLSKQPLLYKLFQNQCPNLVEGFKDYHNIEYHSAAQRPQPHSPNAVAKEKIWVQNVKRKSEILARNIWGRNLGWEDTKQQWLYKWNHFRALPILQGDNKYQFKGKERKEVRFACSY